MARLGAPSDMPTAIEQGAADTASTDRIDGLLSWVEIDRQAYCDNLCFFRRLIGEEVELSAVVKANAYGHGWREIAALALAAGADSFCVHSLEEALALRAAGHRADILVLGHIPLARLAEAVEADLRVALFNRATLERLLALASTGDQARPIRVHLKLETGTHRHGFAEHELESVLEGLRGSEALLLEGAYTHFANIEDTTDHRYARAQLRRFEDMLARIAAAGFRLRRRHAACSAAVLVVPETRFDMVRLGIGQYGFWPSKETLLSYRGAESKPASELKPVLSWKTRVAQLKTVSSDAYIGYGLSYRTTRETRLAVLPIGYSDGYDRRLSNRAYVLIRGQRAPVRGRICMNLTMVDITDIAEVALEDEVLLLGGQGNERIDAAQLASWADTIHYEVVARIRAEIPRIVV